MTVTELCTMLQGVAHEGYGIHAIELLTECENCTSDIILDNPTLEILKSEDQKTVKLLFKNSEHFH